ncbi:MAG TPA: HD domain-containing protein [Tepidisphaeraceae bacterium]|nr:HD domain-containing protein [Tepidisphaeraceae bacterium]
MSEKIIRDPVHDVIAFRLDRPLDALLFGLLNAEEFQRLRRIRQLGMASLAYPGADHSRYSHSLGVMETARKILDQLKRDFSSRIDEEGEAICLVAALLHDLGHGPFSHVFERVSGIHHERLTQRVIMDGHSEVHRILIKFDKHLPDKVVEFLQCKPKRTFYCDVISSQLDADRLDYLLRDNLMTGSGYGAYDLGWLLKALTIDEQGDGLAVTLKGVSAVEAYLQSRYHMYRNVYFHKVVRSAEGMVKLALQRAKRLAVQERLDWPPRESAVQRALTGQRMSMKQFTELDDVSVLHCFKLWAGSSDKVLARLCHGLLYREVYKTIDLSRVSGDPLRVRAIATKIERAIAEEGGEPEYEMFLDQPADTPYAIQAAGAAEIMVRDDAGGGLIPFASVSPLTVVLNQQTTFTRVHVAYRWRDLVAKVVKDELKKGHA